MGSASRTFTSLFVDLAKHELQEVVDFLNNHDKHTTFRPRSPRIPARLHLRIAVLHRVCVSCLVSTEPEEQQLSGPDSGGMQG
jgi:hypothetical protein